MPYEKIGDNEPICIADEVPFEIPESWEWARLGMISSYAQTKKKINAKDADPSLWGLDLEDIEKGGRLLRKLKVGARKAIGDKTFFEKGDVLYSKLRPYLLKILVADEDGVCTPEIVPFKTYGNIDAEYMVAFLQSPNVDSLINAETYGIKMPRAGTETMTSLLVPIPPINEQKKIVAKIKELQPFIDEYDEKEIELSKLNSDFPDQLKKSILQMALQGKLVPQDENDEPASVLLERIRAEKAALIKAGKLKKDKHESVIYRRGNSHYEKIDGVERCIDDEIPFDIPDSWVWCRISSILSVNPRNSVPDETEVGFIPMPLLEAGFCNSHTFEVRQWKDIKNGFTHFKNGDIVLAKITPCFQNRKSAVIAGLPNGVGAGTTELHVLRDDTSILYMPYFLICFKTQAFIAGGVACFTGTAGQQRVGKEYISNYLIPLPPLAEQKRIVEKVNALIEQCKQLIK